MNLRLLDFLSLKIHEAQGLLERVYADRYSLLVFREHTDCLHRICPVSAHVYVYV